uniref:Reverse transcriptase domain-containing protein n=1 Tax=Tanacetum cinerariifolium TaxID=118510 RepID=A0A6L2M8B6_TANCI|nr:reverse transcriptase domain-containing protein [Tanacetum cinerariifolium]
MAASGAYDEIEKVTANFNLQDNLQQESTSGTRSDKAPVYDLNGSAEVHHSKNCYDNDIFNMFTQEEQYTELLDPIPEPHQVPQNDNNVISEFIRSNPFILKKWHPDENLLKEDVSTIPVWVKLHGVPVMAFNDDGLSAISIKRGAPLMLDSYTSDMCMQSWGRSSHARVMIKLLADVELKDIIIVAMSKINREGHYTCNVYVECPEYMRISEFMHGVNNLELTKRLNEHVPKTMEEMIAITTFIQEETAAASKKKRVTRQKVTQSFAHVKEITFPPLTTNKGTKGPLIIEVKIGGHAIHRICLDRSPSVVVLYEHCLNRIQPEIKNQIIPETTSLTSFSGETIWLLGQLRLLVTIGDAEHYTKAWMNFMIVRSPYNGIIGRMKIRYIQAVPSTTHGMLKFPMNGGIVTIHSTILTPSECTTIVETLKETAKKAEARLENFKVAVHLDFSNQEITIGGKVSTKARMELCTLLKGNLDIFAWQPSDMMGVPRSIAEKDIPLIVIHFQNSIGRSNPSTTTPLSVFWTPTKAIIKYKWHNKMRKRWLSTPVTGRNVSRIHDQSGIDKIMSRQGEGRVEAPILQKIKEGHSQDTGLFREPSAASSQAKLYPMEKVVLALVCAAKRLRIYFQAHPIVVITDQPIKQVISSPDVAGRLQKWSVMLGEHNITYRPRTSVKGQILADFLGEKPDDAPPKASVIETPQEPWTLFTDGSSCVDGLGAGLILTNPERTEFTYALRLQFTASNNEAEYEVLIAGLRIAAQMGVCNVHMSVDSKLVANQVLGTYVAKEENMIKYLEKTKSLISGFTNFSKSQVPRSKNKKVDALSKIASTSFAHLSKQVLVKVLKEKSIQEREMATVVEEEGPTWMTLIIEYLRDETLLNNRNDASKLRIKARQYELLEGILYKRSFLNPWLKCVGPLQADYGIDIVGPFPEGPRKVKLLIVAMDNFTKWIEAKAVAIITGSQVKKFVWDNIVCHFGLLGEIVSDNGKQFSDDPFKDWFEKLNIVQLFALVKHPQSNGLVERANRSLGEGIKARLGKGNKNWLEELPHVLWAHRMTIKSSNNDTPFSLTYRTEAVIPTEIEMPTYRTAGQRCYVQARDFVYYSNDASHAVDGGKLGPKWEGPYEVTKALGNEAYKLRSTDGTVLSKTWNIANLKKCYL